MIEACWRIIVLADAERNGVFWNNISTKTNLEGGDFGNQGPHLTLSM